jgi:N-acetylglutamate synthase-like GNAT family acetyltransferase
LRGIAEEPGAEDAEPLLPVNALADRFVRPTTAADLAAVRTLLEQSALPTADLTTALGLRLWVLMEGDQLVGAVGLERYGASGLLRSLVVSPTSQRRGLGRELVATLEREASAAGVKILVLLTQTAERFFARLGYAVIDRGYIPDEVKESAEFRSLCPASAVCMSKTLT